MVDLATHYPLLGSALSGLDLVDDDGPSRFDLGASDLFTIVSWPYPFPPLTKVVAIASGEIAPRAAAWTEELPFTSRPLPRI